MFIQEAWTYLGDTYDYLMVDLADPRTNNWFLIRHPVIFPLIALYLYGVLKLGPRLMENRKPFELRTILITYNFLQVCVSVYIVLEGVNAGWFTEYNFKCEPVDFSNNPNALRIAGGCHTYYMAKITELLDTVFFVMRKKQRQINFLHLYHHSVMPMISWGTVKYYPGGHGTFIGMINSMVHIVMYFYYMVSAIGPQYQKYLWWKKYITTLQLLQFCIAFLHSMQLLFYDCGFPRWSTVFTLPNAIFFYYLFNDFYKKAYTPPEENEKKDNQIVSENKIETNGYANGHVNGYANGHANGYANGHADGYANGHAVTPVKDCIDLNENNYVQKDKSV